MNGRLAAFRFARVAIAPSDQGAPPTLAREERKPQGIVLASRSRPFFAGRIAKSAACLCDFSVLVTPFGALAELPPVAAGARRIP